MNKMESYGALRYLRVTIAGILCISLLPAEESGSRVVRKREKETLGQENIGIPMLDSKRTVAGERDFCDIILIMNNIMDFIKKMNDFYIKRGYTVTKSSLMGGVQYNVHRNNHVFFVHISVYKSKNKLMVQPGMNSENDLISWLHDYTHILSTGTSCIKIGDTSPNCCAIQALAMSPKV